MAVKKVEIPGLGAVTLCKRRDSRSMRLSISADGKLRVTMPMWLPYKVGEQFASSKAQWIGERRAPSQQLGSGQRVGKAHRLLFEPRPQASRINTRLRDNQIIIAHPEHFSHHDSDVQAAARKACLRALRLEAEQLLPDRLKTLSEQTALSFASLEIKQLKSRWGSCSSRQEITLNLFLMQLPWHLIDYVIVHELTHTKVMQHGPLFWQEMLLHLPNAKELRKEIAIHQPTLQPF